MKRIVGLSLVVLLVAAGVWGYFDVQSRGQGQGYRLARVERGPLTAAVSATGNLNAVITVQVGSQVSGQIKELFVDFNSVVKKGQVVARIDPDIFEAKVNQAKADLASAKSAVLNQQAQVERSRADVENARAAHAEGKAQTAKAQVAVVDTRRPAPSPGAHRQERPRLVPGRVRLGGRPARLRAGARAGARVRHPVGDRPAQGQRGDARVV